MMNRTFRNFIFGQFVVFQVIALHKLFSSICDFPVILLSVRHISASLVFEYVV